MSERTYSAGLVTAYGAAVRGGYRGTYAEFCRQQAEYADNAAAVEQAKTEVQSAATSAADSATSAGASATAAAGSATSAGASATAAAGSATTAGQHKDAAATSATNAASSATAAEAAATSAATSASEARAVLESIPEDYSDLSEDVDKLNESLDALSVDSEEVIVFKQGNISSTTGADAPSSAINSGIRLRSDYIDISAGNSARIIVPTGYAVFFYYYAEHSYTSYISNSGEWLSGTVMLTNMPENTTFIRVVCKNDANTEIVPEDVTTAKVVKHSYTDTSLTIKGKPADAERVGAELEAKLNISDIPALNEYLHESTIDISEYTDRYGNINENNLWHFAKQVHHKIIPIEPGAQFVKIDASVSHNSVIAVLTNDSTWNNNDIPDFAEDFQERIVMLPNSSITITVQGDAKYLYVYMGTDTSNSNAPASIKMYSTIYNLQGLRMALNAILDDVTDDKLVRDVPKSQGVRNAYKKAMQLATVSYTTKGIIKRTNKNATRDIPAGEHSGIIYTGTADKAHYVGYNVSLLSYMTAINNKYSAMYTEEVSEQYSNSKYGIAYHGTNAGAPLGIVCASFVAYCLGMSIKWENHAMPYLASIGVVEKIADQSATGVQLMDILYTSGHVALVTDIYRDARGEPQRICVSESWSPFVRTTWYNKEQFNVRMEDSYTIYRYVNPEPNLDYTPSPFVAVDTETHEIGYEYNDDICTYMGDKAVYVYGDLIVINYGDGEYGDMIIESTTLANPITITLDPTVDEHCINLSSYNLQPGDYTAKLEIGSGYSEPTYFKIVDLPISVSENGDSITVTFDKTKDPSYMQVNNIAGGARCVIPLTDADIAAGRKTFNIRSEITTQASSVTGACYMTVLYHVTDPAGYKLTRSSTFVPLAWLE